MVQAKLQLIFVSLFLSLLFYFGDHVLSNHCCKGSVQLFRECVCLREKEREIVCVCGFYVGLFVTYSITVESVGS